MSPRPAYHYRLPNCRIDEPGWSIAAEWGRWVLVERLAARPDFSERLSRTYLGWDGSVLGYLTDRWENYVVEERVPLVRPTAVELVAG